MAAKELALGEKQKLFTKLVGQLIDWSYQQGYELTFGDAYRSPQQAESNAKSGKGIANSLHTQRLAIDLNLFVNGVYQTSTEAYKPLGEYWKTLHPLACWGGDFTTLKDGNHFSLQHGGRK
jgi:hypothetical protein